MLTSGSGTYDFGAVAVTTSSTLVNFDINNLGSANLVLTGVPIVQLSGLDAGEFSVTQPLSATVVGGNNESFELSFSPTSAGSETATVTVASNDVDEGSYTFTLTGSGAVAPEIDILQAGIGITTGGTFDFGSEEVGQTQPAVVFTIENLGTGDLVLTAGAVSISGTNAADFTES